MERYIDEKHAPSLLPEGKQWKLVWNDEFDGTELDRSKWDFRLHICHQRFNTFTDKGAILDGNSNLLLSLIEKDGHYYSPHLQTGYNYMDRPPVRTKEVEEYIGPVIEWPIAKIQQPKFMHKYGYYEIRCKLQTQPGWWSAFWLQSPIIGSTLDPGKSGIEVDIMENFTRDGEITSGNIWNGYGEDVQRAGRIKYKINDTPDGYHYFGLDWSPDGYTFYADGVETTQVKEAVSHTEQFILVSTECKGYRLGNGNAPCEDLKKAVLPDYFIVDHVRVFDEVK